MKFGVQLAHFGPLVSGAGALRLAARAEALGFDSVWAGDHIIYPPQYVERFGPEFYEALITLAWIAASTPRIAVGTAVIVLPYRNPIILAKELATIDVLSGGRLICGVGAGWLPEEHAALGVPFKERGAAADECLRLIRCLWTEERPRFSGRFFDFPEMVFAPRPLQRPTPPIWVGGVTARALRRAAEFGDGWLPIWHKPTGRGFAPEALREKIAELRQMSEANGRNARPTIAGLMPLAILDRIPTAEEAQPLVGPPGLIAETLGQYRDAGLEHVILNPYYGLAPALLPQTLAEVERLLERFATDVRPRL